MGIVGSLIRDTCEKPKYSVGVWDSDAQAYVLPSMYIVGCVQRGFLNVDMNGVRIALKYLRHVGFSAHRRRKFDNGEWNHDDNDVRVLVERTDGHSRDTILEHWER